MFAEMFSVVGSNKTLLSFLSINSLGSDWWMPSILASRVQMEGRTKCSYTRVPGVQSRAGYTCVNLMEHLCFVLLTS